jgi:hypothetical protein
MLRAILPLLLLVVVLIQGKRLFKRLEEDEFGYGG